MIKDFPCGTPGVGTELRVIEIVETSVSFGDISGCGSCGAEDLVAEAIALVFRERLAKDAGDVNPENPTSFPAVEVFK